PDFARVVSDRHLQRLRALYESAVKEGALIAAGGTSKAEERFLSPTVLTDVPLSSNLMQEEIFGPVLPVLKFSKLDDALSLVNSKPKPLALYIFSESAAAQRRILD